MNVFTCLGKVLDAVADTSVTVSNSVSALSKLAEVGYLKADSFLEKSKKEIMVNKAADEAEVINEAVDRLVTARKLKAQRCNEFDNKNQEGSDSWTNAYKELEALLNPEKEKQNKSAK